MQLSQTSGLFDDFAAQDLVTGFDMGGEMNLDDQLMQYLNTSFTRSPEEEYGRDDGS